MTLSKKRVRLVVALIVTALAGLLFVQTILIRTAWDAKEQAFRRSVFAALDLAVKKLEAGEAMAESIKTMGMPHMPWQAGVNVVTTSRVDSTIDDRSARLVRSVCDSSIIVPVRIQGDSLFYTVASPQHVMISMFDPDSGLSRTVVDTFREPGRYGFKIERGNSRASGYMFRYESDTSVFLFRAGVTPQTNAVVSIVDPDQQKRALVQRVLTQMLTVELKPVEQRIDSVELDSAVGQALKAQGINLGYAYGVYPVRADNLSLAAPGALAPQLMNSEYRTRLFPQDLLSRPSDLVLYFPGRQAYLWKQMGPMLAAVGLFMLVIVFCFAYAIRVISRQRQFTTRMTDFINNMTHEFKTPIATVALASEAISRADVVAEPERLSRFNRMIQDETTRMRTQVDKILQMAVLEEGDYDLNLTEVDVHAIIAKAVENTALHVHARGGSITTDLKAERPVILGDRVHLTNIVHNLLDNANKYSPAQPTITVSTRNVADGIEVSIKDKGVGIAASDQKAIFDKYYRVSNGNVHDVKGFGLGLSYVKLMVTAHGGRIDLESAPGEGTDIRIVLPFDGPKESGK
ncbi:hypothetical protein C3F09_04225 [candidate division GN15 bacterium]|uniref:histidine kinase n=1 Tax=candidate division GN15 bacterium TaxID=2072418 RepID=A0A855X2J9_9BACT|nr:MAG: hypothetical protein C3F09_04225 [candidate division GN15 bacterium]